MVGLTAAELAQEYLLIDAGQDLAVDAIVTAEGGEETLAAVALRIRDGRDFRDLPNLALPRPEGYEFTRQEPEPSDLEHGLVDWSRYVDRLGAFDAPVRTATGCPHDCGFCDFSGLHRPKPRSLESLIAELRSFPPSSSPRKVFFADDNLALTGKRLTDFTRALIREGLKLSWRTFIRADAIDAEAAALMRESGCRECSVGIESGDPTVLENMNKRLDPERALKAVELLDANGISTQCTFVVGYPGENSASIERTAALISAFPSGVRARALQRYYLFRFQVLPLSPVASPEQRAEFGLTGTGEQWSHRTMNSDEAMEAVRQLFLRVEGPSHAYMELIPAEWPIEATRRVMEGRDAVQKNRLRGLADDGAAALLDLVRGVEPKTGPP